MINFNWININANGINTNSWIIIFVISNEARNELATWRTWLWNIALFYRELLSFSFQKGENYEDAGNQNKIFQVAISFWV